jgi:hypothetical protein
MTAHSYATLGGRTIEQIGRSPRVQLISVHSSFSTSIPVGLEPTAPPIHRDRRCLHHVALYAVLQQAANPETVKCAHRNQPNRLAQFQPQEQRTILLMPF